MNLKPEELIREAMRANPEEGIKELRKSSESTTKCCCAVQTTNEWYKLLMREAADQIERDQKEIADLRDKQQWIPVTERMPERDIQVIGWYKDNPFSQYRLGVVAWNGNGWVFVYAHRYVTDVTHWMTLPEPPKEN